MKSDPILDEKETKGNYTKETLPTFNLNNCWSKNSINVKQSSALSGKFSYTTSSHLLAFNNILRVKKIASSLTYHSKLLIYTGILSLSKIIKLRFLDDYLPGKNHILIVFNSNF